MSRLLQPMTRSTSRLATGATTGLSREFDYDADVGAYDETISADGGLRPHWRPFFDQMDAIGLAELRQRWEEAKHLIRENGVTYNVYGDPRGHGPALGARPDPAADLAGGRGRARGRPGPAGPAARPGPGRPVRPADAADRRAACRRSWSSANPGFLRPCHGLQVPGNRYLHLYAADLGRAPDGSILRPGRPHPGPLGRRLRAGEPDRARRGCCPRSSATARSSGWPCSSARSARRCASIAPHDRDNPRVVLLTPGPYNETYFEHAYLARYLGYTLVEGGDLTVRDNRVYLKLLGGLQPVDVILRRLDDDYCDPLELRGDSFLGVPGLVQAVRAGNVAVANALGSGLVETPALLAYLPALCRHLLGEDLKMPSVPTWWCGDPVALRPRPGQPAPAGHQADVPAPARFEPIFGEELTRRAAPGAGRDRSAPRPRDTSARNSCRSRRRRCWSGDRLRPRHLVVRAFLTATDESATR